MKPAQKSSNSSLKAKKNRNFMRNLAWGSGFGPRLFGLKVSDLGGLRHVEDFGLLGLWVCET